MKKIVSLALAVIMAFAMSATAFAATITNTSESHTYEVYQIFTGDLNGKTLSNVKWGANGTGTVGAKEEDTILKELSELDANASDTEKLAVIQKYVNLTSDPFGVIEGAGALEDVPNGYYLIKDLDGSQEGNDDAYTTYLTKIVGDLTIEPKSSKPTVDKEVKDEEDAETGSDNGWGETADHEETQGGSISYN